MRFLILILGFLFFSPELDAGAIVGKVTVYKKGGKKLLENFENTVVYLSGIETPPPETPVVSFQENKQFTPRLLTVIKGQEVQFWNRDKLRHNVFLKDDAMPFDLQSYPKGEHRDVTFKELGVYKLYCNIHQKMVCDIAVLPNKYFSVTDRGGLYHIVNIPPGKYTLHVWHIYGGKEEVEVEVGDDTLNLDFQVVSTKVVRGILKHKNKHGRDYKKGRY